MQFTNPLVATKIIKRYKRFLADVIHPEKGIITVYCPNTGSMKNCWQPGWTAWLEKSANPKRKYLYTWVLTENNHGDLIGINSSFANDIVYEALTEGRVAELLGFDDIKREVKYGDEKSRIDIMLTKASQQIMIEIKSVTLLDECSDRQGQGYFPDAVTSRGQKHLRELIANVKRGNRSILFFLVQHSAIKTVSVEKQIDPEYASLINLALESGVELLVYQTKISNSEIIIDKRITFL